jgi:hypothetical protein
VTKKVNQVGNGATKTLSHTTKNVGNTGQGAVQNVKDTVDGAVGNLSNTLKDTGGAVGRADLKGVGRGLATGEASSTHFSSATPC